MREREPKKKIFRPAGKGKGTIRERKTYHGKVPDKRTKLCIVPYVDERSGNKALLQSHTNLSVCGLHECTSDERVDSNTVKRHQDAANGRARDTKDFQRCELGQGGGYDVEENL